MDRPVSSPTLSPALRRVAPLVLLGSVLAVTAAAAPDAKRPGVPAAAGPSVPAEDAILQGLIDELDAPSRRRTEARARLVAIGTDATPALVSRRTDSSQVRRWEIATILGMIKDPTSIEALTKAVVEDPDSHVRWRSIWAIRSFAVPLRERAAELLLKPLAGGNEPMRWNAAVGLAELGRADGLSLLHPGLESPDEWRRWEAIHALGSVHDRSSRARLARILSSDLESERAETVQSLGRMGGDEAVALLISTLDDPAAGVRARACRWLGLSGAMEAVPPLEALLSKETDDLVRRQAKSALEKLGA